VPHYFFPFSSTDPAVPHDCSLFLQITGEKERVIAGPKVSGLYRDQDYWALDYQRTTVLHLR